MQKTKDNPEENRSLGFFTMLKNSFDTKNEGFSGRKLSAFWGMVLITVLDFGYLLIGYEKDNFKEFTAVLGMHFLFVSLLLGIITAGHIISLKNGHQKEKEKAE